MVRNYEEIISDASEVSIVYSKWNNYRKVYIISEDSIAKSGYMLVLIHAKVNEKYK